MCKFDDIVQSRQMSSRANELGFDVVVHQIFVSPNGGHHRYPLWPLHVRSDSLQRANHRDNRRREHCIDIGQSFDHHEECTVRLQASGAHLRRARAQMAIHSRRIDRSALFNTPHIAAMEGKH